MLNFAVDGFEVAEILRLEDPAGFQLLATVPVRFENNCGDDKSAMMRHAPIIELYPAGVGGDGGGGGPPPVPTTRDTAGNRGAAGTGAGAGTAQTKRRKISAINFSFKSGGYAPMLDDTVATAFYAARRRFSELLHDPRNTVSFQMEPGDVRGKTKKNFDLSFASFHAVPTQLIISSVPPHTRRMTCPVDLGLVYPANQGLLVTVLIGFFSSFFWARAI